MAPKVGVDAALARQPSGPSDLGPRGPTTPGSPTSPKPTSSATAGRGSASASLARQLARFKDFQSGRHLGSGYQVGQHLSAGATGDVFTASVGDDESPNPRSRREVAIKRVRVTNAASQRHVQQEVAAVFHARARHAVETFDPSSAGHPNIVGYLDWFAGPAGLERDVCLVMERCDFSMSDMVYTAGMIRSQYERHVAESRKQQGSGDKSRSAGSRRLANNVDLELYRFTEREAAKIMCQMLSALSFLNRHGILHRDVKTENILWRDGCPEGRYQLADFGTAACIVEGEVCKSENNCGTLWTMAPEMLGRRAHDARCDVWSLGVVLFEVCTFDRPFNSKELLAYRSLADSRLPGTFWPALCGGSGSADGASSGPPAEPHDAAGGSRSLSAAVAKRPGAGSLARGTFWPALCGGSGSADGASAGPPAEPHDAAGGSRSPSAAVAKRPGAGSFARVLRRSPPPQAAGADARGGSSGAASLVRAASVPSLPCVNASAARRRAAFKSEGEGDGHCPPALPSTPGCGEAPASPSSPALRADSRADARDARRALAGAFLRRRATYPWFYSEDLRGLVCDAMLEEDPLHRETAAGLFADERLRRVVAAHQWQDGLPGNCQAPSSDKALRAAAEPAPPPTPSGFDGTAAGAACAAGSLVAQALRRVTGEAFLAAIRLERRARDAAAD